MKTKTWSERIMDWVIWGSKTDKELAHEKEVEELISYAIKEGYLGDEAEDWTDKQKEDYYDRSMAYEPEDFAEV